MNKSQNLNNKGNVCPECGGELREDHIRGEIKCFRCGLVTDDLCIDYSRDGKRAYTKNEKEARERIGPPISKLLPDLSLTTTVDMKGVSDPNQIRMFKEDKRIPWEKRNLLLAKTELLRISNNLNIPNHIREAAITYYKKALKMKLLRGRSIDGMVAACLYFACREEKIPRTFQEILDESDENIRVIKSCYRALNKELHMKAPITDPLSLLPRMIVELELTAQIEGITRRILTKFISRFSTSGRDPKGYCAGAIYLVAKAKNQKVSQKKISRIIGVTEVTLRSRYKELIKKLNIQKRE